MASSSALFVTIHPHLFVSPLACFLVPLFTRILVYSSTRFLSSFAFHIVNNFINRYLRPT
ncbi:MAG: hypothetical protein J5523_05025 [Muribaculaceae bacterium]|nr:hypothetical protein [Muribaculaceae bacterium]